MKNKRAPIVAIVLFSCLLGIGPSWAGEKWLGAGVQVDLTWSYASGSIPGTYYGDWPGFIGCSVSGRSPRAQGYCVASDWQGRYLSCWSENAEIVKAISAMTNESNISFGVSTIDGTCYYVTISNISNIIPKQ